MSNNVEFALRVSPLIVEAAVGNKIAAIQSGISFSAKIAAIIEDHKRRQPYHLNLLDEIKACENDHSRIFTRLLAFHEEGRYPYLELFLKGLEGDFSRLQPKAPDFKTEKHRIDVLVCDRQAGFALIIENKVNGAVDQEEQVVRYIKKLLERGYAQERIFVLYLTRSGGNPSEDSFPAERRNDFEDRYQEISYKDHILPFLENEILPICRARDFLMLCAIQQYVDYLKGIFHKRNIDKNMNEEIKKTIHHSLNLNEDWEENQKKVAAAISNIDETRSLLEDYEKLCWFRFWHKSLKRDYDGLTIIVDYDNLNSYPKVGIKFDKFSCLIESNRSEFYYGISKERGAGPDVNQFIGGLELPFNNENTWWYKKQKSEPKSIYDDFKTMVSSVKKGLKGGDAQPFPFLREELKK